MLTRIKKQWNSGRTVGQIVLSELGRFLGGLLPKDHLAAREDRLSPLGSIVGDRAAVISEIGLVGDGSGYRVIVDALTPSALTSIDQLPSSLPTTDAPVYVRSTRTPDPLALQPMFTADLPVRSDVRIFLDPRRRRAVQSLNELGRRIHLQLSYEHVDDYLTRCVLEQDPADSSRLDLFVAGSFPDETHSKGIDDYITNMNKT
jgi:hypothetical protein